MSDPQKEANRRQDKARAGKRFQLWLELLDDRRIRRVMKREKIKSKIAAVRWLLDRDDDRLKAEHHEEETR